MKKEKIGIIHEMSNKAFDKYDKIKDKTGSLPNDYTGIITLSLNAVTDAEKIIDNLKPKTFEDAVKPLMQWMAENKHPHTTAIVTSTVAELVEGVECINTDEFLVD